MRNNALTATVIFEGQDLNYGGSFDNNIRLKKITDKYGNRIIRLSKQSLKYSIRTQTGFRETRLKLKENKKEKKNGTIQFDFDETIKNSAELDIFGYLRWNDDNEKDSRKAVLRITDALSLSNYRTETGFLTNGGMVKRYEKQNNKNFNGTIVNMEINKSFMYYTFCIDLERIGVQDRTGELKIEKDQRIKRVNITLDTILNLYKDIVGNRQNISPQFIIGGLYERKNPYFMNAIKYDEGEIILDKILSILENNNIRNNTKVGLVKGNFKNEDEISEKLNPDNIYDFFDDLKRKVIEYYEG